MPPDQHVGLGLRPLHEGLPLNREDLVESDRLLQLAIKVPATRRQLIDHDDRIGGGAQHPAAATNQRDLAPGRDAKLATAQKLAFFPPTCSPRAAPHCRPWCRWTCPAGRRSGKPPRQ